MDIVAVQKEMYHVMVGSVKWEYGYPRAFQFSLDVAQHQGEKTLFVPT